MTEAFDVSWAKALPKLRRFATVLTKCPDDAEDLVSDAWFKCRRAYDPDLYLDDVQFLIYTLRAVKRLHIDAHRRPRSRELSLEGWFNETGSGARNYDSIRDTWPDPEAETWFQVAEVDAVLDWMSPRDRTITQLRMMGLTWEEVGQAMGQTTISVKARNQRLRHEVRRSGMVA